MTDSTFAPVAIRTRPASLTQGWLKAGSRLAETAGQQGDGSEELFEARP